MGVNLPFATNHRVPGSGGHAHHAGTVHVGTGNPTIVMGKGCPRVAAGAEEGAVSSGEW